MAGEHTTHYCDLEEDLGEKNQLSPQSYPWLLIHDSMNYQQRISISNKKYYKNVIPEMRNKKTLLSSYGWLILQDYTLKDYYLFNPITLEKIQLPLLDSESDVCFLSSPPGDSNCHVLFIDTKDKHIIFFCRLGDTKFIKQEFDSTVLSFAEFQRKSYCIYTSDELLGEISFEGSHLQLTPLTTKALDIIVRQECLYYYRDSLIDCSSELLLVHKQFFGWNVEVNRIKIFKFDFLNKDWMEVNDIGQYTIFISRQVGMASNAIKLGVKPNFIYIISPNDRRLQVYNLKNGRISTIVPCPIVGRDSQLNCIILETNKLNHQSIEDSSFN